MYKQLKLVTNYKTNKQSIEYRVFSDDVTFKTIAPTKWLHLNIEDRTSELERCECNAFLVRHAVKDNIGLGVELNVMINDYVKQCMTRHDAVARFAAIHNIKQI